MSLREVYEEENILGSIQIMDQAGEKDTKNTQLLSEKVDDILKEALDAIEDKQDYLHFAEDIDLFSLIEDGLSETDSCQGTVSMDVSLRNLKQHTTLVMLHPLIKMTIEAFIAMKMNHSKKIPKIA